MSRTLWKRALAAALLSAGIGGGFTWMCRAQSPARTSDTVELSIEGRQATCQLVHTWKDGAGKSLHIVFNQSNGEMLTLVPDGNAGEVRIIHWGVGAQSPPANTPLPHEWKFESGPSTFSKIGVSTVPASPKVVTSPGGVSDIAQTPPPLPRVQNTVPQPVATTPPPVATTPPPVVTTPPALPVVATAPVNGNGPEVFDGPPNPQSPNPPVIVEGNAGITGKQAPPRYATTPRPPLAAQATPRHLPMAPSQGLEVLPLDALSNQKPRQVPSAPSKVTRYNLPDVPATSSLEIPGAPVVGPYNPDQFPPASSYQPLNYRSGMTPPPAPGTPNEVTQAQSQEPITPPALPTAPPMVPGVTPATPVGLPTLPGDPTAASAATQEAPVAPPVAPPAAPQVAPPGPLPAAPPLTNFNKVAPPQNSGGLSVSAVQSSAGSSPISSAPMCCDPCVTVGHRPRLFGGLLRQHKQSCDVICEDVACSPSTSTFAPKELDSKPLPKKEASAKIPGTNQPWPVGAQSAVAAYGGMQGKVSFIPVPIATIPEPRRVPQPPNQVPQAPQPTRPDPMATNAFSSLAQAYGPMMPYGAPPMGMDPYGMMANPYAMMGVGSMMPAAGIAAPGYPMMPQGYPMSPYGMPMNPYAVPTMPSAPLNVAPTIQPASFSTYNNAMDRRLSTTQTSAAYGPAHAKHLNTYMQILAESTSPGEREWAANSLAGFDPTVYPQAVGALTHAASKDASPGVRAACINNLSRMNLNHEHASRLMNAFRHETDPRVKEEVDRALGRLGLARASR